MLLDAGQEISSELMAKILKFQLLQIKTNDRLKREAEKVCMLLLRTHSEPRLKCVWLHLFS